MMPEMMLKEWSTIIGALESGEQLVILRKGGIMEAASGFIVQSDRFLLYPTWEHQTTHNIREPYLHYMRQERPPSNINTITSYAQVLHEQDILSDDTIQRLEEFHIWSREYIQSRRAWQPQRPIKAVFLRVFRINPIQIPILDEYSGCKSWLDSDVVCDGGRPILDDKQIKLQLEKFQSIVS
ncbi:MAG: DUF1802 family protein [Cenarchaeum sp. SB0665_bin_23]|nr:DUF1802 family protein [Cenarchaeum sp. SB0667_bin_13]MXY37556.1 DUF1802 family protein [Cenarchaeum sp. SB0664_bin_35]MXY61088.1 DUF1802 family protein [Cenarchaeum sp. SB0665_bin_23]MYB46230.1 DUF1802 family protein [Cenarchaeum sp. SB0662_bin_33]MYC80144.1 DUF1802 family protein [Cenarchaeum sp. SB0661_bin_35]MYG33585.1 DUF1802 family protein [Cenarchaeum sp. SB0677_bin_16]MYI51499.1 DUF1802 family protein [Cenarchaeum sp. SB0673_bin_9]